MSDNNIEDGFEEFIHTDANPLEDLRKEIEAALTKDAAGSATEEEDIQPDQVNDSQVNSQDRADEKENTLVEEPLAPAPVDKDEEVVDLDKLLLDSTNNEFSSLDQLLEELNRLRQSQPAQQDFKDDFIKGVVDYYEKTGDLTPYLQAKLVNYDEIDPQTLLREELRKQFPTLSDKAFDRVYQQEIVDKYRIDPNRYEDEDVEVGLELLNAKAMELRAKLKEEQHKFVAPSPQPTVDESEKVAAAAAEWKSTVENHEATTALVGSGRISVDNGTDSPYTYEVTNKESLVQMTLDNNEFFNLFNDHKGGVDLERWYRVLAYASNPAAFEKSLVAHGKSLGEELVTQELKNPSIPVREKPTEASSGDFKTQLLNAFLNRK